MKDWNVRAFYCRPGAPYPDLNTLPLLAKILDVTYLKERKKKKLLPAPRIFLIECSVFHEAQRIFQQFINYNNLPRLESDAMCIHLWLVPLLRIIICKTNCGLGFQGIIITERQPFYTLSSVTFFVFILRCIKSVFVTLINCVGWAVGLYTVRQNFRLMKMFQLTHYSNRFMNLACIWATHNLCT